MIQARMETGRLVITADNEARADLAQAFRDHGYYAAQSVVRESLHERFEFIEAETIGALTDAPILADANWLDWPDDSHAWQVLPQARVFWFPDYMIRDPWQELRNKGRVVFSEAAKD